jgi:phosphoribosylanthranilate isomerase
MTAVKICGLTRREDVALACAVGASLLGFNFSAQSPRRVTPDSARRLAEAAAPGVLRVGVFVSEDAHLIGEAVEAARLDLIQIHRPLRAKDVEGLPAPVIAVARVGPAGADLPSADLLGRCYAVLFDTLDRSRAGGTGSAFDWGTIAAKGFGLPVLVAGGLTAENVAEAVRRVRPWAVDVASGVESEPGVKDAEKLRQFFEAVRRADADSA